jgi:hypothetical protein
MKSVGMSYLAHNTADAIYRRFCLVLIFLASGRAGEAATATWNLTSWDAVLENLYFDWSQSKSSKQKGISLLSDFECYEIDFFHSLGCYFICGFGQREHSKDAYENHWILPEISILQGSSKKISLFLQDIAPDSRNVEYFRSIVPTLPTDVSGNSLRVGSINEAAARNVSPYAVIMHGGHDMTGHSASWEYVITTPMSALPGIQYALNYHFQNFVLIIVFPSFSFPAAMALSGYPSCYYSDSINVKLPASPNLKLIINETNSQLINNFMNHLFNVQEEFFKVGKKLRPLLEVMFATLIMYHTTLLNKFGQTHIITLAIVRSAREFSVSERMLEEWGSSIRFDWELRNMKLQSNNEENKVLMESIINNNAELQKSNKQQLKEIKAIREEMIELRTTLDKFEGIFKDIRQVLVGTPSKKRKTEVMYIS